MLKKDARKHFITKRKEISTNEKMKWDDLILIHFQTLNLPFLNNILSFYPIEDKNEINSFLLTEYLRFKNPSLQICYPKTDFTLRTMHAIACHADSIFEENEVNIFEPVHNEIIDPEHLELILIPLLAFDADGNRVGYGKGFYDRYLKQCGADCLKVGVSQFPPIDRIDDAADFDVPLDFCITPEKVYVF